MSTPLPPFVQASIKRLETLIEQAEALPIRTRQQTHGYRMEWDRYQWPVRVPITSSYTAKDESPELNARIDQAIRDIAPSSAYAKRLERCRYTSSFVELARALCADLRDGFYNASHDVAHAEVFIDFLDMAQHLLDNGYKDAAAVIAGSSNETHLRLLMQKHLPTESLVDGNRKPLNGNALNAKLAGAKVYDANTAKYVTAWQGTRNDAAHGDYAKYDAAKVQILINGIQAFVRDNPA